MAQGIEPVTRVDVSPTADEAFHDVDVSALGVAAGAEGVILEIINTAGTKYGYDVRKEGSTDDFYTSGGGIDDTGWTIRAVGLDASRIFEATLENAAVEIYLIGYIPDGAGAFLTNAANKSTATLREFVDVDVSGDTGGDTAKIAFFIIRNGALSYRFAMREEGSTDDRYTDRDLYGAARRGTMMSLDASEVCEQEIENAGQDLFFIGWINTGFADSWANAKAAATETTGSYVATELTDIGAGSNGAFFFIGNAGDGNEYAFGIRDADLSHDNYYDISEIQYGYVGVNASKEVDQKLENTNQNLYYWGYVKTAVGPTTYERNAAVAVGIAVSASRNLNLTREASTAIGIAVSAIKIKIVQRLASTAIGIAVSASRALVLARVASTAVGVAVSASRNIVVARVASVAIGIAVSASRALRLLRYASTAMGITVSASRALALAREASTAIGITASASRALKLTRAASVAVGIAATASRALALTRVASVAVGIAVSASRIKVIIRKASVAIGVATSASFGRNGILIVRAITAQYRTVRAITSQYRLVRAISSYYRKLRAIVIGG